MPGIKYAPNKYDVLAHGSTSLYLAHCHLKRWRNRNSEGLSDCPKAPRFSAPKAMCMLLYYTVSGVWSLQLFPLWTCSISMCILKSLLEGFLLSDPIVHCDPGPAFGRWLPRYFRYNINFSKQDYNWSQGAWTLHLGLINIRLSFWANCPLGHSSGHLGKDSQEPLFAWCRYRKMALWGKSQRGHF